MATIASLDVKIRADSAPFRRAADQVTQRANGLSRVFSNLASVAGGFVLAQGIMRAPAALMGVTSTARDLELQMKKANTVFGEQIGVVRGWASANAHAMGLSRNEATNLAASFGDLLVPMGFSRDAAAKMSTEVVGLAGALSEWSGGTRSSAEVANILSSAMLGEREALKGLGISITEAEVSERLLAKGQDKLTGKALQQAKAIATQEMIFEKSTDAQAAFAKGSDSAARKQAEMRAQMQEAKEALARGLAPAITKVTTLAATGLVPALSMAGTVLGRLRDIAQPVFEFLSEHKEILAGLAAAILTLLVPALWAWVAAEIAKTAAMLAAAAAFVIANAPLILIAAAIGLLIAGIILLVKHWDEVVAFIKDAWAKAADFAVEKVTWLKDQIVGKFQAVKDKVLGIIDGFKELLQEHWREIVTVALAILFPPGAGLFALVTNAGGVRDKVVGAFKAIPEKLLEMGQDFLNAAIWLGAMIKQGLLDGLKAVGGFISDLATEVTNAIIEVVNIGIRAINDLIPNSLGFKVKGVGVSIDIPPNPIPEIAKLARGGLLTAPTVALLAEAGQPEIVSPEPLMRRIVREEMRGAAGQAFQAFAPIHVYANDAGEFYRSLEELAQ